MCIFGLISFFLYLMSRSILTLLDIITICEYLFLLIELCWLFGFFSSHLTSRYVGGVPLVKDGGVIVSHCVILLYLCFCKIQFGSSLNSFLWFNFQDCCK